MRNFLEVGRDFISLGGSGKRGLQRGVIFPALDVPVKNVVCTYSLEHNCIDEVFSSIFHYLDELMDPNENISKLFQELICCIGILQATTFQHMQKEEEQVFPLLMQKVSIDEQALLVWQFICSVPIMLLREILPWMVSFLSAEKQAEVRKFLNEITPMEKELQEVLIAWLGSNTQTFNQDCSMNEAVQRADGSQHMKRPRWLSCCNTNFKAVSNQMKANCSDIEDRANQVNILHLWHNAIKKDMKEMLEELHQIRNNTCFHNLDSLLIQLKFFADVLICYSNAQKKFFYPVLSELAYGWLTKSTEQFFGESHVEDLQQLLLCNAENSMPSSEFVEKLCRELGLFVARINKQFAFQETEVFPVIRLNCSNGTLEELISLSLHMMPLGLLKCAITWFAGHLSENESRSILNAIKQGNTFVHEAFASLVHEWFRVGYSGKTSIEKFRQDLRHIFKSKSSLLTEQVKEAPRFSFLNHDKPHKISTGNNGFSYSSSSGFSNVTKYETPYSTGINMHIFFPATVMKLNHRPGFQAANSSPVPWLDDSKPIDLIFFFHKAIKNDLDYLVLGSARIEKNVEMLVNFNKRFHLIRFLHRIHSETEDEIAFPALEAMSKVKNISLSYTIDHKFEVEHFNKISCILDKMFDLHFSVSSFETNTWEQRMLTHHQLCRKLQEMCKSMHKLLSDHMSREETEIWHLIRELFSNKEQIKIIGCMLGRIRAEILQDMIPWLMTSLTPEEQHVLMFLWSMIAKNTMFDEWLAEWWDGYRIAKEKERSNDPPLQTVEPLEIISKYLSKEVLNELHEESTSNKSEFFSQRDDIGDNNEQSHNCNLHGKSKVRKAKQISSECSECRNQLSDKNKQTCTKLTDITSSINDKGQTFQLCENSGHYDHLMKINPDDLEMAIRRVSRDSSLDLQKKSCIIQNLLMSRWIVRQHISFSEGTVTNNGQELPGQYPSYRDPLKLIYGCKHYKRSCKLLASCCNQLYTCIHCHNDATDHLIDRKSITKMMCMKCLKIQPISATCSTVSCGNLAMAKYYCRICRLFDDEREIYHCPYCNLCRVGKGLGLDYFHCMNCNACMARSLTVHICREKSLEDNCPICHEYIFTSCSPVKALPCGHVMHSTCFKEYTYFNYTCPICYKSLGDMQVYFRMLDAYLAEEKIPDEHLGKTQMILCNDCEKKGTVPFHWLYHKCSSCGSYNTRVL
ncbi:zinc finger protein BRUTUS-like At1g18910 isoform X3 [Prosopis cineraria]|uniref:zinc finger protein BRUTUS-like At1g18910 isoform X3 n=1 Tax=Prosopis cineraria TaxID=364024 RepID=UPI002410AB66|nr:zinc finger protein BRUTUS-like At1g18910 isoform X3 [Prosopis cineraria]